MISEQLREKLNSRPGRGGVRLTYAEAGEIVAALDGKSFAGRPVVILTEEQRRQLRLLVDAEVRRRAPRRERLDRHVLRLAS